MNPLDRNHDGKVNLQDLKGQNNIVAPGTSTTTTTTTSAGPLAGGLNQGLVGNQAAHHNPLDRNHDGRVNLQDLSGQQQGLGLHNQGLVGNQGLNQGVHHNPLDRNHDGRVNLQDLSGQQGLNQGIVAGQQTTYVQSAQRSSIGLVRAEPTKVELIEKDVVIHERIHPVQKEEIQPIIYREREQLDVKQVTQMMHETQIQPTIVQQRELPAQTREAIIERGAPIQENFVAASREVDATLRTQVVHAPIVNEVIKKTIIEEIQPVLERDIITSTVIQNTQPIYEKIVEAPSVYREVRTVQDRGLVGGDLAALEAQGFNLGETGRRLSQTYTTSQLAGAGIGQGIHGQQGLGLNQGVHHNPLDRNHDGRVNMQDLHGNQGLNQGIHGQQGLSLNQGVHHNPLDRNHDGRVNLQDLSGQQGLNHGLGAHQGLGGETLLTQRGIQTGMTTNTALHQGQGLNSGLGLHQGVNNQGLVGNQGLNQGAHLNPLDRNHDGKVNLQDISGRQTAPNAHAPVNTL